MSDMPPDDKDGLLELLWRLLKKLWLPIAGFIGAVTLAFNFYKMWLGDKATVTYITAAALLIVLTIFLSWVGLSKKIVVQRKKARKEPRYSKTHRQIAFLLLGILWIGTGSVGWLLYKNNQAQIQAIEKKVIVLVAQFDGPEETYGIHRQIMEDLRDATKDYDDTIIIEDDKIVTSSENARELGEKGKVDLVIWAWYRPTKNPSITMHFENLSTTEITGIHESETYEPQSTLAELQSFEIQRKLGSETSTLISFLTGLLRLKAGDYQVALERFEQILQADDISTYINAKTLYLYTGLSHQMLGQLEQSIQDYDMAIELDMNLIEAYGNRGNAYNNLGQFDRAIEDYNKAIELNPNDALAFYNRGLANYHLDQFESAIRDYDEAIKLKPDYLWAYNNRSGAYIRLKQYELAIQDNNKAITLDPNYPLSYFNRGVARDALGQYELAIDDYDKTIELDPSYVYAYLKRGSSYSSLNEYERAIKDFNKAINLKPDLSDAYFNRGNAYMNSGQYDNAINDFTQTILLEPNSIDAYVNRGITYGILGQYERAISDFNRAIDIDPQDASVYKNRALANQRLGKLSQAEADFKKYEELTGQKP